MSDAQPSSPSDRRQLAKWAREDRFRMRYGVLALLTGWFVTFFVFCLGLTLAAVVSEGNGSSSYLLPMMLIYGFPVALVIGLPLAILIATPLRRVANQWAHVAVFTVGVGAATALASALLYGGTEGALLGVAILSLWAGASAAMGRASVMKLVTWRNESPPKGVLEGDGRQQSAP